MIAIGLQFHVPIIAHWPLCCRHWRRRLTTVMNDPNDAHLAIVMRSTQLEAARRRDQRATEGRLLRQRIAGLFTRSAPRLNQPMPIDCVAGPGPTPPRR